jgi:hypothetical protein
MKFKSIVATILISVWTCSFALGAEAKDTPTGQLIFSESVERAMQLERLQMPHSLLFGETIDLTNGAIAGTSDFRFVPAPESLPCEPNCSPPPKKLFRLGRFWHRVRRI